MQPPRRSKIIGILGGMSPQATSHYYRLINAGVNATLGGWETAEIVLASVNFGNIERFVRTGEWDRAGTYLNAWAKALENAGADFLICVSNTMHRVADKFLSEVSCDFIHIVDPTGEAIQAIGISRVGLIGTLPVMRDDYLRHRYEKKFGLDILVPSPEDQQLIDAIIFDELVKGVIRPSSKDFHRTVIDKFRDSGAEGVILGCTETFLVVEQDDFPDLPMFNTTQLHVDAAVKFALDGAE